MEILRIEWHKGQLPNYTTDGYMELKPAFFPCTVKTAKGVFKLMRDWCSEEQFTELLKARQDMKEEKRKAVQASGIARKNLALVKKYDKNIELLQQMKRG